MPTIRYRRRDGREDEVAWAGDELEIVERPSGPAAAALLAAGFGVFVLGLLTTLAEASTKASDWLNFQDRVGPLSGKTIIMGAAWAVAWALASLVVWRRSLPMLAVYGVAALLLALGVLGTFPKFFELFAD